MSRRPTLTSEAAEMLREIGVDTSRARLTRRPSRRVDQLLCLPSPDQPQLVVPLDPAAAVMVTDRRSRRRHQRWMKVATAKLIERQALGLLPIRRLVVDDPALRELAAWVTGGDGARVGVLRGPLRANRKPVLRVVDGRGDTLSFVKVGFDDRTRELVRQETTALATLADAVLPGLMVPRVQRAGCWRGLSVLATSPLAGDAAARPSDLPVDATRVLFAHGGRADLPLRATAPLSAALDRFPDLAAARDRLVDVAGDRCLPTGASHGDWTPWNLAVDDHGQVGAWDWERYTETTPAGFDAVHYAASRVTVADDFAATRDFLSDLPATLEACGLDRSTHRWLLATYLVGIAGRYAADLTVFPADRSQRRLGWVLGLLDRELDELAGGDHR